MDELGEHGASEGVVFDEVLHIFGLGAGEAAVGLAVEVEDLQRVAVVALQRKADVT